jgi:ferredoxin-type protein NapG
MENANKPKGSSRRQFLADTARMACGVGLLGVGLGLYARHATALPPAAIRPPGALPETEFSAACIRCGLCVRDCPFDILLLAKPEEPMSTGTPYFVARQAPCEMCEDIPCIKACPTNALDHSLTDITKSKMGLAVLVDQETCLNFLGLRCDICYRVCPVLDKAITLDPQTNARTGKHTLFIPVVHSDHCTGCGLFEKACRPKLPPSRYSRFTWPRGPCPLTIGSAGSRRKRRAAASLRRKWNISTTCPRA